MPVCKHRLFVNFIFFLSIFSVCPDLNAGFFDELQKGAQAIRDSAQDIKQSVEDSVSAMDAVEEVLPENEEQTSESSVTQDFNKDAQLVRETQSQLQRLGYPVAVDGAYGPGTQKAIMQFQSTQNLAQTGEVSPALVEVLSAQASPAIQTSRTVAGSSGVIQHADVEPSAQTANSSPARTSAPSRSVSQPAPASSNGNRASVANRTLGLSNRAVLAYKLRPELLENIDWEALTKQQIERDQAVYTALDRGKQTRYVPFFSREEVLGRHVDFAARSLLPKFKNTVLDGVNQTPVRLDIEIPLNYIPPEYDFDKGVLDSSDSFDYTFQIEVEGSYYYLNHAASRVVDEYEDSANIAGMPQVFSERYLKSQALLAFDRWLTITNYKLPPSAAEKFLVAASDDQNLGETFTHRQEAYGRRKATAMFVSGVINGYEEIGEGRSVKKFFTVEVQQAEIRNGEGEVLLGFERTDFPSIADKAAERAAQESEWASEQLARDKAAEDRKSAEEEKKRAASRKREEDRIAKQQADRQNAQNQWQEKVKVGKARYLACTQVSGLSDKRDCLHKLTKCSADTLEESWSYPGCDYFFSREESQNIRSEYQDISGELTAIKSRKNDLAGFIANSCNRKFSKLATPPLYQSNPDYKKAYSSCEAEGKESLGVCQKQHPASDYGTREEFGTQDQADAVKQCIYDGMFSDT